MNSANLKEVLSVYNEKNCFSTERLFKSFKSKFLVEACSALLNEENIDLETATLIYNEIEIRKSRKKTFYLNQISQYFKSINHYPIPWLKKARQKMSLIELPKFNDKYKSNIYLVLRDGYSERNFRYGIYVGTTTKTIQERYLQHTSGINSGRGLKRNGLQIMKSLFPLKKIKAKERLYFESAINILLKSVIPKVTGDVQKPINIWPKEFQKKIKKFIN